MIAALKTKGKVLFKKMGVCGACYLASYRQGLFSFFLVENTSRLRHEI